MRLVGALALLAAAAVQCAALPWDYVHFAETLGAMYEFGAGYVCLHCC